MICHKYYVEVDVPPPIYDGTRGDHAYQRDFTDAVRGCIVSGFEGFNKPKAWAEFHSYKEAEACERRLMDLNYKWAAKLL